MEPVRRQLSEPRKAIISRFSLARCAASSTRVDKVAFSSDSMIFKLYEIDKYDFIQDKKYHTRCRHTQSLATRC